MIKRLLFLILLAFSGLSAQQTQQLPYALSTKSNVWGTTTKLSDGTEQYSSTTVQKVASGTRSMVTSMLISTAVAAIVYTYLIVSGHLHENGPLLECTLARSSLFAGFVVACADNDALAKGLNDKNNKAQMIPTIIGASPLGVGCFCFVVKNVYRAIF